MRRTHTPTCVHIRVRVSDTTTVAEFMSDLHLTTCQEMLQSAKRSLGWELVACVCALESFFRLNPSTSLVSSYPLHPPCANIRLFLTQSLFFIFSVFYPFFLLHLSSVFPSFIVFGFLSVILQGKGNKRPTHRRNIAPLLLFCSLTPSFLSFIFVCCSRPYREDGCEIRPLWFFVVK